MIPWNDHAQGKVRELISRSRENDSHGRLTQLKCLHNK
jgi:hypothetical protein